MSRFTIVDQKNRVVCYSDEIVGACFNIKEISLTSEGIFALLDSDGIVIARVKDGKLIT